MKKLMIAAAIICAAAFAQASSVSWAVDWAYAVNTSNPTYTGDETFAGTYWLVALSGDSTAGISVDDTGKLTLGAGMTQAGTGSISESAFQNMITGLTADNNGDKYALVIYDSNYKYYGVSDVAAIAGIVDDPPTDGTTITFSNIYDSADDANYMVANIQAQAVPEPTSGLLLLLGVAGLALRRRRA